jgi:hypothetical protein
MHGTLLLLIFFGFTPLSMASLQGTPYGIQKIH